MGRKRTHDDATRTKIVSARLKPETYELVSEHAQKLGLSRAGYIEHLIENRPLRIIRPASDALPIPLLNELKRIGNNLNQMARARNAGHDVDPRQFRTVVSEIIATICSNEVLRRRYEEAKAEVADKRTPEIEEAVRLRKVTAPDRTPARPHSGPRSQTRSAPEKPVRESPAAPPKPAPRQWPPESFEAPPPRAAARSERPMPPTIRRQEPPARPRIAGDPNFDRLPDWPVKTDDPKTSSSWFKLPWGVRVRPPRR